jgi:diaminohydroxyphosphoribosylaminopyrimidine deaminase / 5-amino-6-(5-phosphoribosylamino)uracil reductase
LRTEDEMFMKLALRLARKGVGRTSPNPAVGAVIVRRGEIIASGFHKKAGGHHAEIESLLQLGGSAQQGDVLYVTLEPCNHQGRTPPCTEAILRSGIRKVVVGMKDPNRRVAGGGCEFLAGKGIEVITGTLEEECRRLNEAFVKFVTSGRPFVAAKTAMTLDGWTATSSGDSQWVTNEKSREYVHHLRDEVDAVMVGIGTIFSDDPLLTTRLKSRKGRDPLRIILDTNLRIAKHARVLHQASRAATMIVVAADVPQVRLEEVIGEGVSVLPCPRKEGKLDLAWLMEKLATLSVTSILVEGGATLMGALFREGLIDKFYVFKALKVLGGSDGIPMALGPGRKRMDEALCLKDTKVKRFGDDLLVIGYPDYGTPLQ